MNTTYRTAVPATDVLVGDYLLGEFSGTVTMVDTSLAAFGEPVGIQCDDNDGYSAIESFAPDAVVTVRRAV